MWLTTSLYGRRAGRFVRIAAAGAALMAAGCTHRGTTAASTEAGWRQMVLGLCEDYPEESRTIAAARRDLELVRESGAKVLRIAFGWDAMEPHKGTYDWGFWDEYIPLAVERYGVRLIPYVCYTPRWAARDQGDDHWRSPPRDPRDFADFLAQLTRRYGKWIDSWELWNEPDNPAYWTGSPAEFAALTRAGSVAVRQGDPGSKVVLGGLAGELDFLETLFRDEALAPAVDVVNFHSYLETWHPDPIEELTAAIERARDIVESFGENEPLWMAEVGYSSVGPRPNTSEVYRPNFDDEHTAEAQANAMIRFVVLAAASRELDLFAWYRINDLPADENVIGDDNNRHLGLLTRTRGRKPAAAAFAQLAAMFSRQFRVGHIEPGQGANAGAVHAYLFEYAGGARMLFAWEGMPPSAEGSRSPEPDTRTREVELRIRRGRATDGALLPNPAGGTPRYSVQADGDQLRIRLQLSGSNVVMLRF